MTVVDKMDSTDVEEDHMVNGEDVEEKPKLKIHKMESTILDSFTKLTRNTDRDRITGGTQLLKHLSEPQDIEKYEKEFSYILDRLVRGIGTSRVDARKGFYSTLVALMVTYKSRIPSEKIIELMKKNLQTSGSCSKSEKADIYMGQILTIGALIRAELFEQIPNDQQKELLEQMINSGNRRSFLSLAAYSFIISYIEQISEDVFSKVVWPVIQTEVNKPLSKLTLDQVWFLLIAREKFPNVVKHKTLRNTIGYPEILHDDAIKDLCDLLMNTSMLISVQHPIYEAICIKVASSKSLSNFCKELNTHLHPQKFNRNKFIVTLTIINHILTNISDENIPKIADLLLANILQECIKVFPQIRHKKTDELNIKFNELFTNLNLKLSKLDNANPAYAQVKVDVLKRILFFPGTFLFEKITGAKIVQQITSYLATEGVKELSAVYREVVLATEKKQVSFNLDENWLNIERLQAANILNRLLAHPQVVNEHEWRFEQIKFLLDLSLFKTDYDVGLELAGALRDTFYHSLDQKLPKLTDVRNLLSQIINYINDKLSEPDSLRTPFTEEQQKHWSKMYKRVSKLEKKKTETNDILPVFHILLMHMGIQLFSEKKLAISTLDELKSCYDRVKSKKDTEEEKMFVDGDEENSEPLWIEVIVDLFLNLLSQNNHLFRRIVGYVFPYLCPHLTVSALHQILSVLDPNNDNQVFISEDDEDEDSDSEEENENGETEMNGHGESGEDSAGEDMSDIDDYEDEPVNDKLRMALHQALGRKADASDAEESDVDLDNMDEEEGKRIDKALAEAFRSIKGASSKKSKSQSKADKTLTHFRVRVLDLIETYVDSEHASLEATLEIMVPLLQTLEFSIKEQYQQPLERRLRGCLNKLTKMKKFANIQNVTEESLVELLKSFLDKGDMSMTLFKNMGDTITKCCIFIIKSSMLLPQKTHKKKRASIESCISDALTSFFDKRDSPLPSILFNEIIQINWTSNWKLIPRIVDNAFNTGIRPYRRNQALTLLLTFYKNQRFFTQADESLLSSNFNEIEQKLFDQSLVLLEGCSNGNDELTKENVKEKFLCSLMTLFFTINNCHKICKVESCIDWNRLGQAICNYQNKVTLAKTAKKAFAKLTTQLGIGNQNTKGNKRKRIKSE